MPGSKWLVLGLFASVVSAGTAGAKTICTIVADARDGRVLVERGDCRTRVTSASTFKVPLALMGFDSGLLTDAKTPVLPFKKGDVDWGGDNWRRDTDPTRWMRYSVVWYSQRLTHRLGAERLTDYARRFGFGNADFSGDPGRNNGLDRAWIMSSLKISPVEQVAFWRKLVNRELPVSRHAFEETNAIIEAQPMAAGWTAHGKTGAAVPRRADGSFDRSRSIGWFVGSAEKNGRRVVFARLVQDERKEETPPGGRARDAILAELPALVETASKP